MIRKTPSQRSRYEGTLHSRKGYAEGLLHKWEGWLAAEPTLLSLFGFLPPVAKKRALRARVFLREAGAPDEIAAVERMDAIDGRLKTHVERYRGAGEKGHRRF